MFGDKKVNKYCLFKKIKDCTPYILTIKQQNLKLSSAANYRLRFKG